MATTKKVVKTATKKAPLKKVATKKAAAKPTPKKAAAKTPTPAKKTKTVGKANGKVVASAVKQKEQKKLSKPIQAASKKPVTKLKAAAKTPVKKATTKVVAKPLPKVKIKAAAKVPVSAKKVVALTPTKKPVAVKKPVTTNMAKDTKSTKEKVAAPKKETFKKVSRPVPKDIKDIKVIPAKPVTLPKIKTKTSRPFQPDFKSVLDQPVHNHGESIVRYTDAELMEFRELITRKLESAKKEWNYLQGLISRKDETGGDESENRYMTMEDGSLSMEREQLSQMASRQVNFIDHLEKAIMRIENKTYGICRVTGKLIDKARLRAVPHATLCIEAKMNNSK